MKPIHLILSLISLILCSCASTARADAIPQIVKITPTVTISETATPTPDLPSQLDAARKDAEQAREAAHLAIAAQLDAEAKALNAQATAQAAQVAKLAEDNRRAEIQLTAQAAEVTRQAAEYAENARADNADIAKREAEAKRLNAEAEYIRAGVEEQESATRTALMVVLAVAICAFAWAMLWLAKKAEYTPGPEQDEPEVDEPQQIVKFFPAGLSAQAVISQAGITAEQLIRLARGINAGEPFTHARWTPAENGFSEGKFTNLQYVLVRYGRAAWSDDTHKGGAVLTRAGRDFFGDLLKQTTSPLNQPAQDGPESDGYRPIDTKNPLPE